MRASWMMVLLAGCGGAAPATARTPSHASAVAAASTAVACDRETQPPLGARARRLEVSLEAAPGAAEVTIDGVVALSSAAGSAAGCAYLPIAPGVHKVELRAGGDAGVGVKLGMAVENAPRTDWYDVFSLACGVPGVCLREDLVAWRDSIQKDRKQMVDPCSATVIRDVKWDDERLPGKSQVSGLALSFTLSVYAQSFDAPPRDPSCPES